MEIDLTLKFAQQLAQNLLNSEDVNPLFLSSPTTYWMRDRATSAFLCQYEKHRYFQAG